MVQFSIAYKILYRELCSFELFIFKTDAHENSAKVCPYSRRFTVSTRWVNMRARYSATNTQLPVLVIRRLLARGCDG